MNLLEGILFLVFLVPIMLAGSGIQTASSTRPGAREKGSAGSTLFTLSLPVTRTRLFVVRTIIGALETSAVLTLVLIAAWLLLPPLRVGAHDALGLFAVVVSSNLFVYAISACLSTFCDEGWRARLSLLVLMAVVILMRSININIVGLLVVASPLFTHQIPWMTIIAACVFAVVVLTIALIIIQKREY